MKKGGIKMIGIYKITNNLNGHCYIGQSINIITRWNHHRNYPVCDSDYPLYRAFAKYGIENFTFEIIEECAIDELDAKEVEYIKYFDSYYNGYNQTQGGSGSRGATIKISNDDLYEIYDLLQHSTISQKDIAARFNVGEDTISEINHGKTRRLENFSYPLRNNRKALNLCIDCGVPILATSIRCNKCEKIASRVVQRPDRNKLKEEIRNYSFLEIGRKYGVSDNAIRKWCIAYGLPYKKSVIKTFSDLDWDKL